LPRCRLLGIISAQSARDQTGAHGPKGDICLGRGMAGDAGRNTLPNVFHARLRCSISIRMIRFSDTLVSSNYDSCFCLAPAAKRELND
jgi:hypothetical protein